MEAVVLCGIQGAGKTAFYAERFLHTHARVSLDLLRTRHREARFLGLCLETRMRFVVDNTNPTRAERERYVRPALDHGFRVVAYWVDVPPRLAIARNAERAAKRRVPVSGVLGTRKRFEVPSAGEGFAELWRVVAEGGRFAVTPLERPEAPEPAGTHC
jgi:predicted kinase